jgi:hypothetical protein
MGPHQKIHIHSIPKPQIDHIGGRHRPGTRIINHMPTGEDVQEKWEEDHGALDDPTFLRNRNNLSNGNRETKE